ncbi:DUF1570 domain-containing protein [Altererythrobacter xixiisoli]|uniref:DUF1570 domain-containing protein n=1 Tax=Croceibacterium xixiisoli TaxID=1476466 RepID=A0A6I4U0X9_9SPHN|nr:DUF1570 domain-containing protein [Croceibacterium xixiisoli]MXP00519.1 DUF1570 domain-containing protein [Croceibacterium xixiisoli]
MRFIWFVVALLLLPSAAKAEWLEASSPNFVVYADDSERDLQLFTQRLELYHEAMKVLTGTDPGTPSPSNRVTVYVVKSEAEVQRILNMGRTGGGVGGFYIGRAGAAMAVVPTIQSSGGRVGQSMAILLHEYAHHFLLSGSVHGALGWMNEGGAEFFAGAQFNSDGGISLGLPNTGRYRELSYVSDQVTAEELLDPDLFKRRRRGIEHAFYARSWGLYHYLTMEPERRGQMARYVRLQAEGAAPRQAAEQAFGNLADVNRGLNAYLRRTRLTAFTFAPGQLTSGAVQIRQLSAGEAEIMPVRIRSRRGVTSELAAELVVRARAIAARHPQDAAVLSALAETEFDAGNDAQALAAADAALAIDSAQVNAYVQKGYALFRQAETAEDKDAAFRAAVVPFVALNRMEPDHPLGLYYYYLGFVRRGRDPSDNAMAALARAVELAPFDTALRLVLARQQISSAQWEDARYNLLPIANSPHGGALALRAREVIDAIVAGPPADATALLALLEGEGEDVDAPGTGGEGDSGEGDGGAASGAEGSPDAGNRETGDSDAGKSDAGKVQPDKAGATETAP